MEMTSKEFRRSHLMRLLDENGSMESVAAMIGISPQYLSQLKSGFRGIGDRTPRKIEKAFGWEPGTMDRPPQGEALDAELAYILRVMPENEAISVISDSLPHLSEDGLKVLTSALLKRLSAPAGDSE